jgi:hypothetical protein
MDHVAKNSACHDGGRDLACEEGEHAGDGRVGGGGVVGEIGDERGDA